MDTALQKNAELPVLIIGAGLAGLTVALHLAKTQAVIVMAKRSLGEGATAWAQGGIVGVLDQADSVDAHVADTLNAGAGLVDETTARYIAEESAAAIQWLVDQGKIVRQELLTGWWIDTGKLTPLLEANRLLLEVITPRVDGDVDDLSTLDGRVVVEAGATVRNSILRGPLVIGKNARIIDSFIGPFTAIGDSCEVVNSEIEHSVIMQSSRVIDIKRLEDSLIGREAEVIRSQKRPRALRLMIGDHCQIDTE